MVEVFAAFSGGLISFLSPCVLPLVPGYISMLSGIGVEQLRQGQRPRNSLMASALAFTVGLSVVFIAFGASASAVGQFLKHNRSFLAPIAGALVFLFGLHLIGVLGKIKPVVGIVLGAILVGLALFAQMRPGVFGESLGSNQLVSLGMIPLLGPGLSRWLNRDLRFHNLGGEQKKESSSLAGIVSGFLMGFGFAFGWTPCVGVILTPILALAASRASIIHGMFLLAVYSAGLAVPFLLAALGLNQFLRFYQKFRRYLNAVEIGSGVLLLGIGFLIFTNQLTWLSGKLSFLNRFIR
ncbi:MAG: cytochrome c biogenesis protein CcdA [Candidatus Acidiferrales bacterium]